MATTFYPGQTLGRIDLSIKLQDANSLPTNAFSITYAIYFVDPGPPEVEVVIGSLTRTPINPTVGEYFASLMVPPSAVTGTYRIRWTFQQYANSPVQTVTQEFTVVATAEATQVVYTDAQQEMIDRLRVLLRDQNPDKFYHFRPPEHGGRVGAFDRVFGQIWEDNELHHYLEASLDFFNMFPPSTFGLATLDALFAQMPGWKTAIWYGAMALAFNAVAANWVADEFDYSIGGVSLSIEKSSKYESLKQNAEAQFDKATEAKRATVKFMRGLQQPRFGIGIRSAFGPHVGRGVLSPRNFL
tara:strand:+ start:19117 stop:20013 length:897 start_codon:yes stop_codon:yes gene_type:complete